MSGRVMIHYRNVYRDEFSDLAAGRQLFVIFDNHQIAAAAGDVVTLRELADDTGDRTGRELTADIPHVLMLTDAQVVGVIPRTFKLVPSGAR